MGMTLAEKILAKKSGLSSVVPGQIVDAYPDLVMSHTATWLSVTVMEKVCATKLYDPDRIAVVLDHIAPAKSEKNAAEEIEIINDLRSYDLGEMPMTFPLSELKAKTERVTNSMKDTAYFNVRRLKELKAA